MEVEFTGEVIEWRGPAPHLFVPMPEPASQDLREQPELSYGWGCIAAEVRIGQTTFTTSLMPRDGVYLVPMKGVVRRAEAIDVGDEVTLTVRVAEP